MYPYLGESQFRVNHYSFLRKEKAAVWNNEACGKQQVFLFVLVTSKVLYMLMSVVFSLLQPLSAPWPTPWGLSVMIIFSFYYAVHNKWPIRLFELMSKWMKTKILCFLEIHFWRKKKSLTCICRGDIFLESGQIHQGWRRKQGTRERKRSRCKWDEWQKTSPENWMECGPSPGSGWRSKIGEKYKWVWIGEECCGDVKEEV